MKKLYTFLFSLLLINLANAQGAIASWNFNASTLNASSGVGTLSFEGGTGSATYVNNSGTQALAFANFPDIGVGSGTAGIKFATSTVGYKGISISFDTAGHNQSSRWQRYEYTANGTDWIILGNNNGLLSSTFTTVTLNFPATCDNNPNFAFRIVSIFNPNGGTQYEQVQGGGYNGNNGKWYFDNVGISFTTLGKASNAIAGLQVYPNPAKTSLFVTSDSFTEKQVVLYDVLGKIALKTEVTNQPISVTSLPKGMYIAKITEEGKTATRKVVIE